MKVMDDRVREKGIYPCREDVEVMKIKGTNQ